jgi:alpha-galactosidase
VTAVQTAPFWSAELGAIAEKRERLENENHAIESKNQNSANADGQMTDAQKQEHMAKFEADLISPQEAATWKRGASNAGYHYLGCAKTFALMGRGFAEANIQMMKK